MKLNRNEHSRFVQWLDRTAEKNPLLWLPCILLITLALAGEHIAEYVQIAYSHQYTEKVVKEKTQLERKPLALRFVAMALVVAFGIMFAPIAEFDTYAFSSQTWDVGYKWNDNVIFTADNILSYNTGYSIKIDNTSYNDAWVERTFNVLPHTKYKFSAMVKYSGLIINPVDNSSVSGASIGIASSYNHSDFSISNTWEKLEFEFETGIENEITLCLRNGMYGATCKGTAWFSDIKLEKNTTAPTNEWNVLAVIFKEVNAPVNIDGISYNYNQSLDETDVNHLTNVLNNLYTTFDSISGGRMKIKNIDVAEYDHALTSLAYSDSYHYTLDTNSPQVKEALDYYLSKGSYNQIIAISPIRDISQGWAGLGGGKYNGVYFCQANYKTRDPYPGNFADFPDAIFVHEMLHCVEFESKTINQNKTAGLHDNLLYNFQDIGDEWRAWYTAYMRSELPGGMGLDPSVFWVYNDCVYELVSDDMSIGNGFENAMPHIHQFSQYWNSDNYSHWQECTCGERSSISYHIENRGTVTVQPTLFSTGIKTYFCTVCGYPVRTETIPATDISQEPFPIYPAPVIPPQVSDPVITPDNFQSPIIKTDRNNITVTLDCDLSGLSRGKAHISTKRSFFENSAKVCLTNDDKSHSEGKRAMSYLNNEELICYPFDISIYNIDNGSQMQLMNNGYINFKIPIPKSMAKKT